MSIILTKYKPKVTHNLPHYYAKTWAKVEAKWGRGLLSTQSIDLQRTMLFLPNQSHWSPSYQDCPALLTWQHHVLSGGSPAIPSMRNSIEFALADVYLHRTVSLKPCICPCADHCHKCWVTADPNTVGLNECDQYLSALTPVLVCNDRVRISTFDTGLHWQTLGS